LERLSVSSNALLPTVSEKAFQQTVIDYARLKGWRVFHPYHMHRSSPGWPDLILVKGKRLLALELKSERGRLSPAQKEWLAALAGVQEVHTRVFRPSDWGELEGLLSGGLSPE
jgi:hypothetical protein